MKYVIILCDGMADSAIPELGGKTPLEYARTENFDLLAKSAEIGLCKTVPEGLAPGSDVANLSVLGYDPSVYYKGRSSLEAASIGVALEDDDITLRCNFVHLSDDEVYENKVMEDYSGGNVSTEEAEELLSTVKDRFETDLIKFYKGTTYKHCTVLRHGGEVGTYTPPHDISGQRIADYLPAENGSERFLDIMRESNAILKNHPINVKRREAGLIPADYLWFWGAGSKPNLPSFLSKTGLSGGVISAVDLIRGIGILAGMSVINVPGITGGNDTNFKGKARYALDFLKENDFVYIHVDSPDECSHKFDLQGKIEAIESIDGIILKEILNELDGQEFAVAVLPDHFTLLELKTHVSDPVPYMIYSSTKNLYNGIGKFAERDAKNGPYFKGFEFMEHFIKTVK